MLVHPRVEDPYSAGWSSATCGTWQALVRAPNFPLALHFTSSKLDGAAQTREGCVRGRLQRRPTPLITRHPWRCWVESQPGRSGRTEPKDAFTRPSLAATHASDCTIESIAAVACGIALQETENALTGPNRPFQVRQLGSMLRNATPATSRLSSPHLVLAGRSKPAPPGHDAEGRSSAGHQPSQEALELWRRQPLICFRPRIQA